MPTPDFLDYLPEKLLKGFFSGRLWGKALVIATQAGSLPKAGFRPTI